MKILQITPSYKPAYIYGGPTVSVSRLCEEMHKAGHEVKVLTTTANGLQELPLKSGEIVKRDGVEVQYFSRWTGDHTHFSPGLLIQLWKDIGRYQVIHIQSWWNLVSVLSFIICLIRRIKPVVSPRGMISNYTVQKKGKINFYVSNKLISKLAQNSILHATSTVELEGCLKFKKTWSNFLLPNIIELPGMAEKGKVENNNKFRLLFLSRLDPKKGFDLLLKSLANVDFDFILNVHGNLNDSYEREMKQLADRLNLADKISWNGWTDRKDVPEIINKNQLLVLTSHNENFANVVLESLSLGVPVLVSENVGLEDFVRKFNTGWVCKIDYQDVAKKLILAHENIVFKNFKVDADLIMNYFNATSLVEHYITNYKKLILNAN